MSLKDVANFVHYSENYVIKTFKSAFNQTPFEYLSELRIKEAERLLENTAETVEKICYSCGYRSYVSFYKIFTKKNGCTPLGWRKMRKLEI